MTRKINQRIVFPGLGITIELMQVSASRAKLGLFAPKGIRILRYELLDKDAELPSEGELVHQVRRELLAQFQDRIDDATEKVFAAQQKLKAGQSAEALKELSKAIEELDSLRSASTETADDGAFQAKPWEVPQATCETTAGYANDRNSATEPSDRVLLVRTADLPGDEDNLEELEELDHSGVDYSIATSALEVFCGLSSADTPTSVVFDRNVPRDATRDTIAMIRCCTNQRDLPISVVHDGSNQIDSTEHGLAGVSVVESLNEAVATLVKQRLSRPRPR
ncbi:MAG: carbon storage regulator [Planctomycetota bacterium]